MPGELVLSRKEQQRIIIELDGRLVELAVHDIRSDKVRLRFNAPPDVVIDREEVWLRRQAEAAAGNDETKPFISRLEDAELRELEAAAEQYGLRLSNAELRRLDAEADAYQADADAELKLPTGDNELKLAILRDRQQRHRDFHAGYMAALADREKIDHAESHSGDAHDHIESRQDLER
jgi:sRNA-binding carbon storage regulator CsrA